MNEDLSPPFELLPARPRRPTLGALLVVVSYVFPFSVFFVLFFEYKYGTIFGTQMSVVSLPLYFVLLVAGRAIFKIGSALRHPDAIELMNVDRRPPVLYLRSFDDDGVPDQTGSLIPFGTKQTIEMRLSQVFKELGPFISIGRPGERLPEVGANRFYVSDNDWQQAVLYFLERSAAIVIVIGSSTGISWEIKTALSTVSHQKILLAFPYLLSKEKRTIKRVIWETIRPRSNREIDSVSKTMLADLRKEQEARFRFFREKFGEVFSPNLPFSTNGCIFLDFYANAQPRLIPTKQPLFIRRQRDRQGLTLDYRRTLRPFLEKIQGHTIKPDWVEWFFSNTFTLEIFTAVCMIVAVISYFKSPRGVFYFLGIVSAILAYWGAWNLVRYIGWISIVNRLAAAVTVGWLGIFFFSIVYLAGMLHETPEGTLGEFIIPYIDGLGGMIAGFISGFRLNILGRTMAIITIGVALVLVGTWVAGLSPQLSEQLDTGEVLVLIFPCLAIGGAIWGVIRG